MQPKPTNAQPLKRIRAWYVVLLVVSAVFVVRLFYLQVIRHDYYQKVALETQLKERAIPAERGTIVAHRGEELTPLVLNEQLYTLFADPVYIKDAATTAAKLQPLIGGSVSDIEKLLKTPETRYVVLGKKLTKDQQQKLESLKLKGVGTRETPYRTYPEGQLAAQVLGFVNDEGQGTYGVEQALNASLQGKPGELKAVTDAQGVPLVGNKDNVIKAPTAGQKVVLTLDVGMQQQLEEILKNGLDAAKSTSGSALILDANTGAVKAMANYPTYNPAEFYKVADASAFNNAAVSSPLEVGSIMKVLTAAAAVDQGLVNPTTTYSDPSRYVIDGYTVKNIEEDGGAGVRSVTDILTLSLNTGATWLLMQMGGGQINEKARTAWHDYMLNHYHLGQATGIEQGNNVEADGSIPDPKNGYGLNLQYANTAFGQGMTATPLQMGAAVAAVINGGTYYQPHLVDGYANDAGGVTKVEPKIWKQGIVKEQTSRDVRQMMEAVVARNYLTYKMPKPSPAYSVGGKTGTAEIAKPGGGYYDDRFNGTFVGFVGGDKPQYVIVVRVNEPHVPTYAGAGAAAPIFGKLTAMLINNFGVTPRR